MSDRVRWNGEAIQGQAGFTAEEMGRDSCWLWVETFGVSNSVRGERKLGRLGLGLLNPGSRMRRVCVRAHDLL